MIWHATAIRMIPKRCFEDKLSFSRNCLIEGIDMERHLDGNELVVVGGESDRNARPLDYSWVLDITEQCIRKNVSFEFRQCGTNFIKDSKEYKMASCYKLLFAYPTPIPTLFRRKIQLPHPNLAVRVGHYFKKPL